MHRTLSSLAMACFSSLALVSVVGLGPHPVSAERQPAGLRIVVIEGEGSINIIQQKTAVAPIIEVRDRNDQPVAGAVVSFAIRSGRATFGGARTLSVTTNAAGRAIAAGFAPTGSGALQISATAAFQGQTAAAVTIAQTTVQTAAQAAAVGSAGSAGGSSGGASAGAGAGGGGLSGTTIGIVGAAAAGTVVAVRQLSGGTVYKGQFAGTLPMRFGQCVRNEAQTGTLELKLTDNNGTFSGQADVDGDIVLTPGTCTASVPANNGTDSFGGGGNVSGSASSLTFTGTASNNFPASSSGAGGINSYEFSFAAAFNGAEIVGTLTVHREIGGPIGTANNGTGTVIHNVTLR